MGDTGFDLVAGDTRRISRGYLRGSLVTIISDATPGYPANNSRWWGRGFGSYCPEYALTDPITLWVREALRSGGVPMVDVHVGKLKLSGVPVTELSAQSADELMDIGDWLSSNRVRWKGALSKKCIEIRETTGVQIKPYGLGNLENETIGDMWLVFLDLEATGTTDSDAITEVGVVVRRWCRKCCKYADRVLLSEVLKNSVPHFTGKGQCECLVRGVGDGRLNELPEGAELITQQLPSGQTVPLLSWSSLVSDPRKISPRRIEELTGITNNLLRSQGRPWVELVRLLEEFMLIVFKHRAPGDVTLLVAHNGFGFDYPFFCMEERKRTTKGKQTRHSMNMVPEIPKMPMDPSTESLWHRVGISGMLDSIHIIRSRNSVLIDKPSGGYTEIKMDRVGLQSLLNGLNVPERSSHRAIPDCLGLVALTSTAQFEYIWKKFDSISLDVAISPFS